ncbi:3-ketosteroid-delta-1-dehydrogenase [Bacillus toyonensis]|uniref:NUMOD4 domain-containing protein n=1 Tax=Bacillus toyonensis TaxID=155322 RepID=UPI000BF7ABAA|nr:NUMOD4 domain-containing protein [Bacillus toyonensis]PFX87310.1 3-ketosteroid-delta-1-dehydrogenase [Bacillus toyonensis]
MEDLVEERRSVKGYEEQYDITRSGRIISKKNNQFRHKKGDEYGYKHVHLHKNGTRKLCKTFDVWRDVFRDADISEYKGIK